jgi:N-acylneuraminate cytidylyltransferase
MPRYLCVIPARGGSRRVPQKNVKPLGGKPLIVWTVEYALRCTKCDRVIVSTDDEGIASVVRAAGAEVPFMRPANLALDDTKTEEVLIHALTALEAIDGYRPDAVITMQATSPFRRPGRLEEAIGLYESDGADSVFSAVPQAPFLWRGNVNPEPLYDSQTRPFTHQITKDRALFLENGSLYISNADLLRLSLNRLGTHPAMLVQQDDEGLDIDTLQDFAMAELMMSRQV